MAIDPNIWRRFLLRGESAVASTGLALAAILLVAITTSTWWIVRAHRQSVHDEQTAHLQALTVSLGSAAEALLEAGEITAVRRLVAQAGHAPQLQGCRISLGDGTIIADADAAKISHVELPAVWPRALADAAAPDEERPESHREMLTVPGRGAAILEVVAAPPARGSAFLEAQSGAGAIGAACLVALLLVYRHMRRRFRGIGAVREALMALAQGESDPGALIVSERFGDEAVAWNRLIEQRAVKGNAMQAGAPQRSAARSEGVSDLEGMCDAMWQGLILVDDQLQIKYANGAAALLLQFPREEIVGFPLTKTIADENVLEPVRAIAVGGTRQRMSVELERAGDSGPTVLRFSARPVRRGDSAAAMIVVEDITQQRVAEDARNTFVAQATHELRTPLTNIRLYVENAIEEGEKDPLVRVKCLNVINQESRRLERIVGDMLSVSEIEAGTMKLRPGDVRLDALFAELRADYQAQAAEKRMTLAFHLPPKFPVMQGDRDKLVLTLHNLIGNALKYTPEGGSVTVTVDLVDGRLVVDVADTGLGITDEEQERIFEKFYRSKDSRIAGIPGSGLGLALARDVIRMHGGEITVRSKMNEGSTFTMSVPLAAEAA